MNLTINTPRGIYKYKFVPVFNGVKMIDKRIAKENLLLFNSVAKDNGLKFCLVYGTLLGAIREHDFIDHDEDIDLGVLSEDLDLFKSTLWDLREKGFEVIRYDRRNGLCSIMRKGEYIDFYFFGPMCKGIRQTLGDPIPEKYVTELTEIDFQGDKFLAAKDAVEYMQFNYGKNWNVPINTNNFEMSWLQKRKALLQWWVYYMLPDFIFNPWMKKRAVKKIVRFNMRAKRLEEIVGSKVFDLIPLDLKW